MMTDSEKMELILEKVSGIDERVDGIHEGMDGINERIDGIHEGMDGINERMDGIHEGMDGIHERMDVIEERVNGIDERVRAVEADLKEVKERVIRTAITVENEIRVNIQRVAEGHLDLSRKLNESIKLANDVKDRQEIQDIYIKMHDSKLSGLTKEGSPA